MKNGLDIFLICDIIYPVDNYVLFQKSFPYPSCSTNTIFLRITHLRNANFVSLFLWYLCKMPGGMGGWSTFQPSELYAVSVFHSSSLFWYSCALFCTFLQFQSRQLFCFHLITHSASKKRVWGTRSQKLPTGLSCSFGSRGYPSCWMPSVFGPNLSCS